MANVTLESIFTLMVSEKLTSGTKIHFNLGGVMVNPKEVSISADRGWHGDDGVMIVQLSAEFIEAQVQNRMKELFSAQVDAMFAEKEKTDA